MREKREAKYRVGVIGCGRAGTSRARAFDVHPLCKVVAIADTDAENLALGCRRFGVPGYATYEEMLARESIDIAMPVLPVRANAGAVVAAAEAGAKAIFLRKTADGPAVRSRPHGGELPAAGRVPGPRASWCRAIQTTAEPTSWPQEGRLAKCSASICTAATAKVAATV